jgi:hypothetical protein
MAKRFVAEKPMELHNEFREADFYRADIQFHGVDHSGATFEGRVFLNNPKATDQTPKTRANGYAGSFYVLGHGGCFGDEGHCDVPKTRREHDLRRPHALTPAEIHLTITDALRDAVKKGPQLHVSVVPVVMASNEKCDLENVFKFSGYDIKTYAK